MDVKAAFGLDPQVEKKGQRVELPNGGVVYVGRANSTKHRAAMGRAFLDMASEEEWVKATDDERAAEAELRAARTLVLGWENFTLGGEELIYCDENVDALLREFDLFYSLITNKAGNIEAYRVGRLSEVISEVGNGSNGTSPQKPETSKRSDRLRGGRESKSPPESSPNLN